MGNSNTDASKEARALSSKATKERNKPKGYLYFSVTIPPEAGVFLVSEQARTGESKSAVIARALVALRKNS